MAAENLAIIGASAEHLTPIASASITDILSAVSGGMFMIVGCIIRRLSKNGEHKRRWLSISLMTGDLLKGAAFFPFVVLALSIASTRFLELLAQSNRLVLCLSGLIAAMYVLAEFVKSAQGPAVTPLAIED